MIKQLKKMYNLWLFRKYGFNRGVFFEQIPTIYKLIPLWSPSLYSYCGGFQIRDWILRGMEEMGVSKIIGKRKMIPHKTLIDISSDLC